MDLEIVDHLLTITRSVRKGLDLSRPVESGTVSAEGFIHCSRCLPENCFGHTDSETGRLWVDNRCRR